jgi:disulfide bond formation protein DsbB
MGNKNIFRSYLMKTNTLTLYVLLLVAAALITACGGGAPAATPTPEGPKGDPTAGKPQFEATCSACHGPDGKGVAGLGKDLTTSTFAKGLSDADLIAFINKGRDTSDPENTTGVAMPPKGGNPALDETDLLDIIAYLRVLEQ